MATYMNRNGRITAIVHIKPLPRTAKTFATAAEAERWANALEAEHRAARRSVRPGARPVRPTTWHEIQRLPRLDPDTSTVGVYFLFDGEECVYVGQSRQVHTRVREHRTRRKGAFTSYAWVPCQIDELDQLEKDYLLQPRLNKMWTFERHRARYDRLIAFAIFSTRRQEEITRIAWADLDEAHSRIMVRDMKHPGQKAGNDTWCDLPEPAMRIIQKTPRSGDLIFPYSTDAISAAFTRACAFLEIEDLHFHDLRHEGISWLFETGHNIPHAAAVSGHRSWTSLKRYTQLRQRGYKYAGWKWLEAVTA